MDASSNSPFADLVSPILQNAQGIDDVQRADLFDAFHDSRDEHELAQHLAPLALPDQVKSDLYEAKKRQMNPVGPLVEKAFEVVNRLGGLDNAEAHPHTAKALLHLIGGSSSSSEE